MPSTSDITTRLTSQSALELYKKYSVKELSLFGSYARWEANETSDVDLLIDFKEAGHIGIFQMFALQTELEKIVEKKIEFTGKNARKTSILTPFICNDLQPIYG